MHEVQFIGTGNRVFPHVTPATEQLQALIDHFAVHIAQPHLGHGRIDGVQLAFNEIGDALVDEGATNNRFGL